MKVEAVDPNPRPRPLIADEVGPDLAAIGGRQGCGVEAQKSVHADDEPVPHLLVGRLLKVRNENFIRMMPPLLQKEFLRLILFNLGRIFSTLPRFLKSS